MDMKKWPKWLQLVSYGGFFAVLATCSCWIFYVLCSLHTSFRVVREDSKEEQTDHMTFKSYLMYRFAYWFVWTDGANAIIIILLVFMSLLLGAATYCFCVGTNMWSSLWSSFVWLVAPDAGAMEPTYTGSFIGAIMSLCGLVLFALLLTLMQDSFASYLEDLKNGRSVVMESEHIVLIGMTDSTMPVIQELCKAYEVEGGAVIVILSHILTKGDMEDKIKDAEIDMCGSKVVVRAGLPHVHADLKMVSCETARSIVVMADLEQPKEMRDAFVLRCLIGLRGKGWPGNGEIVAVCSLLRNRPLLEQTGGSKTEILMPEIFVGNLMVQCSKHQGLGAIVKTTFGFDGSEFYITKVPERLVGKSVEEAALHYPLATLCGTIPPRDGTRSGRGNLAPGNDYVLKADEELVLLAADSACIMAKDVPCPVPDLTLFARPDPQGTSRADVGRSPERILIMGWNDKAGNILLELDSIVPPNTEVVIVSPKNEEERDEAIKQDLVQMRDSRQLANIKTSQVSGVLGSRFMLEELPDNIVSEASRIFILADDSNSTAADMDSCTITVLMQIRDVLVGSCEKAAPGKPRVAIVPEIMDTEAEMHCQMVRASDFIDTSGLPSKVLAMIAYNPRIADVLDEILREGGVSFAIRRLQDYIQPGTEPPSSVSFYQVQILAGHVGDVVVGWTLPHGDEEPSASDDFVGEMHRQASCSGRLGQWEINPDEKVKERAWDKSFDKLVVLSSK